MTHVDQVRAEIQQTELKLEGYKEKLAELTAKNEAGQKQTQPLLAKVADGDIAAIKRIASLRSDLAALVIEIEAVTNAVKVTTEQIRELENGLVAAERLDKVELREKLLEECAKKAARAQAKNVEADEANHDFLECFRKLQSLSDELGEPIREREAFRDWFYGTHSAFLRPGIPPEERKRRNVDNLDSFMKIIRGKINNYQAAA